MRRDKQRIVGSVNSAPLPSAELMFDLRQVITERAEDHPVETARLQARRSRWQTAGSRPGVAAHVRELRAVLERSPGSGVELVPEPERSLDQSPRLPRTCAGATRGEAARGRDFDAAACVVEGGRAVSDDLAGDAIETERPSSVFNSAVTVN